MKKRLLITCLMSLIVIGVWAEKNEDEPIINMTCTAGKISFKLYATEETVFQVDFGEGAIEQTVKTTGTAVNGSASGTSVNVYGDANKLKKIEISSNKLLKVLDFSKCLALTELSCSSCQGVTEIILPSSTENQLTKINCRYLNLASFDASKCTKLKTLALSNADATLETLILPENTDILNDLTLQQCGLTTLDISKYTNLTNLDCTYNFLTSIQTPNSDKNLSVDCSYNYMIMPNFPEGENITLYYMDQREKVSQYTLNESYTTNDIIDLSEFYVSKKGIRGSYFTDGVYPTFTWYTNGNSDPLEEGKDYTTTEPGKFKFNIVPENSVYCVIASKAYPAYQDYNSPYRTTDTTIEKAAEPAIILTTSNERVIGFSLGATEDNTSIQIDWGDGNLVDKVINSAKTSIQGTPAGTKNIKIYADAAKIKEVSLAYCDYLTGVDLSKCTALQTLSIKESSKITSIAYPEDITTLENLTIDNSSIKNIDLHNWSGLKNLKYSPYGASTIVLPDEAGNLENIVLSKLSLKAIDLNKYVNLASLEVTSHSALETLDVGKCSKLTKLICKRDTKLATLILPEIKTTLTELDCEYTALTAIDLKEYSKLQVLNCSGIKETILPEDPSTLTSLTCKENGLKVLDISSCTNLTYLDCSYNELTEIKVPGNPNQDINIDCSYNYLFLPNFPEGEKIDLTYMDQREKVSQYTLSERYTTNDIIDLSELYVLKQGIKGSYFPEGVYPTFTWYVNGSKEPLEEGKDYSVTEPAKFRFNTVPEGNTYCVIASKAYPDYQDYNSPYRTTDVIIEKAADPVISLTTSNERSIGFSIGATEDNTTIQIDWGDGNLVDKVINSTKTSIQGTPTDTKIIKIYTDAAKIKEISLAYCDYLTGVDLSRCTALEILSIKESSKIATITYPENIATITSLTIENSNIRNLDIHDWSGLKNLNYAPSGTATIVLPDETENLETVILKKLSSKTIDLSKYTNLTSLEATNNSSLEELDVNTCSKLSKLICKSNTKLATLTLPTVKTALTELNCEYTALASINLKEYTNLQMFNCSGIKEATLPENAATMTSLTCKENGLKTLDISSYINLTYLDCSYNELTKILVPESLNQILEIDCSYNYMIMPNFPEGEKIKMSYIYQKDKVMKYELASSYKTDETIDFSDWYVKKKGLADSYFPNGVYPTFEWYLASTGEKLSAGKDYTVTEGCKFRFNTIPDGAIYCVISSKAYPDYTDYNEPYQTTSCVITQGTGLEKTNENIARIYATDTNITIIPTEDCTYSVLTSTGQVIANGEANQSIEVAVGSTGIYIVCIRTKDNTISTYKIAIQ